jgi:hypothetical protein
MYIRLHLDLGFDFGFVQIAQIVWNLLIHICTDIHIAQSL